MASQQAGKFFYDQPSEGPIVNDDLRRAPYDADGKFFYDVKVSDTEVRRMWGDEVTLIYRRERRFLSAPAPVYAERRPAWVIYWPQDRQSDQIVIDPTWLDELPIRDAQ